MPPGAKDWSNQGTWGEATQYGNIQGSGAHSTNTGGIVEKRKPSGKRPIPPKAVVWSIQGTRRKAT